jgi:hypothetical protein
MTFDIGYDISTRYRRFWHSISIAWNLILVNVDIEGCNIRYQTWTSTISKNLRYRRHCSDIMYDIKVFTFDIGISRLWTRYCNTISNPISNRHFDILYQYRVYKVGRNWISYSVTVTQFNSGLNLKFSAAWAASVTGTAIWNLADLQDRRSDFRYPYITISKVKPLISKVGKWPSISGTICQLNIESFDIRYRLLKIW